MNDLAGSVQFGLSSVMSVEEVDRATVNGLFERWDHPLGPCERPFGHRSHVLVAHGKVVAATHMASIVSPTLSSELGEQWKRKQLVELARIARAPEAPWAMRPMLRLWRELAQQAWGHWPVDAAVSYGLPGYTGDIYRFDGWERIKVCKPANPGKSSTWAKGSATDSMSDGKKTLWLYRYPAKEAVA